MKLLILGGTAFVGRHIVHAALARGHAVTVFHRGKTNVDQWPEVEKLRGDRDGDLAALRGRTWDGVIDTSAYTPRVAAQSAQLLAESVCHYAFVSTVSVYADFSRPGITERAPRAVMPDDDLETVRPETYGALKARAERAVAEHFPGKTLIVRPGIIVGPYDYTGRFGYWPRRIAQGGDVLAPGAPSHPLQVIDARDLAAWMIARVEVADAGLYNATGPAEPLGWGAFLHECIRVTGAEVRLHWVADKRLADAGVNDGDLPLWAPATPRTAGFHAVSNAKAVAAGLTFRPLADSIAAALEAADGKAPHGKVGASRYREAHLLRRLANLAAAP